jgi:hypothetical protein
MAWETLASELKGATIDPNGVADIGRPALRSKPPSPTTPHR